MPFVAVEGPDGSGKTTLVDALCARGAVRVPGCSDSPIGRLVRRGLSGAEPMTPDEIQCAYTADRLARDEVNRENAKDHLLVSDRWTMSALVYGVLHYCRINQPVRELVVAHRREWLWKINATVIRPDLYVLLAAPAEVLVGRVHRRSIPREIYEDEDQIRATVELYETAKHWVRPETGSPPTGDYVREVDATLTPEELEAEVVGILEERGYLKKAQ